MKFETLSTLITTPYFSSYQLPRVFPEESSIALRYQVSRFVKRGVLIRLKRGMYLFPKRSVDEFVLAGTLYHPSYISLESALHLYGVIPDIPAVVTSITATTSNTFTTPRGVFSYSCLSKKLFFGYRLETDPQSGLHYTIAEPEKALLDWIYLRKVRNIQAARVDSTTLNRKRLLEYAKAYPLWVQEGIQ